MHRHALVPSLLLAACAILPASDYVPRNLQRISSVPLPELMAHPEMMLEEEVKFPAVIYRVADLHDTLHNWYRPELYANVVVWDARAKLWDNQARTSVFSSLYLPRERFDARRLTTLSCYEQVEVAGRIRMVVDGTPQFEVTEILPTADTGAFTEAALYHIAQAIDLAADEKRDLAEDHFAAAMATNLPLIAAIDVALMRGRNLLDQDQSKEAIAILSAAVDKLSLDLPRTAAERSDLYSALAKAQVEEAERNSDNALRQIAVGNAKKAQELDPSNGESLAVLGIGLAGLGQAEEARRACDQAVRLRPNDAEVRWYLGRILDQQGRTDEAIEALKKAIDLTPKDRRIHLAIAAAYYHRGLRSSTNSADLALAVQEYDITLRLDPHDVATVFASGQALDDATERGIDVRIGGQRVPATRFLAYTRYHEALDLDPKHVPSLLGIGRAAIRINRLNEVPGYIDRLRSAGATTEADSLARALERAKAMVPTAPVIAPIPAEIPSETPTAPQSTTPATPVEAPAVPVPVRTDTVSPAALPEQSPENLVPTESTVPAVPTSAIPVEAPGAATPAAGTATPAAPAP